MILICILLHIYNNMYKNDIICWYLGGKSCVQEKLALIKNRNLSRLEVFMQEFYKTRQFWGTKIAITPPNINIF